MKVKVGDKVVQRGKDYAISKIGWKGVVTRLAGNYIRVLFDEYPRCPLEVEIKFMQVKGGRTDYSTKYAKNRPEGFK